MTACDRILRRTFRDSTRTSAMRPDRTTPIRWPRRSVEWQLSVSGNCAIIIRNSNTTEVRTRNLGNNSGKGRWLTRVIDVSGSKSDRSMSPNAMSEEERRELIARQHRALYGDQSALYNSNNPTSSQDVRVSSSGAGRGPSPLAFDPFGMQSPNASNEGAVQMPARDKDATGGAQEARANSNSSPSSNQNPAFSLFENAQQASRTSNSSPGGSPPHQGSKSNGSGVAPIGTRPTANQGQAVGAALNKRGTSPLPSPLSYSYNASESNNGNNHSNTTSASLNPSSTITDKGPIWGNKSGVWGNTPTQGVQASVWG